MNLNTCNFIKRIEQVLAELDISVIEDYYVIIIKCLTKIHIQNNDIKYRILNLNFQPTHC